MELDITRNSKDQLQLFKDNSQDLTHFGFVSKDSGKIIDKIPYKDASTGELKWKIIRELQKPKDGKFHILHCITSVCLYILC